MSQGEKKTLKAQVRQLVVDYQLWMMLLIIAFGCSQNKKGAQEQKYICPMHPTVIQEKPGTCPVCGMELVLKGNSLTEVKSSNELNYLLKPVNAVIVSTIKTITPTLKSMDVEIKSNGIITYDTRSLTAVSSRVSGRVEKLFIKYNFQPIRKGQKILEIYSPDLQNAQRDLLYLLQSDRENSQLINGAKEKLKLLGMSDEQMNQLISTGRESNSFSVYSSKDGYITNSIPSFDNSSEVAVREGMYITAGEVIFNVVNVNSVWAEFDIFSNDVASVKINDRVQIHLEATGEVLEEKIDFIEPFYKEGQSFTKVRVILPGGNSKYRIGQLVSASLDKPLQAMWIPLSARLDLGTRQIVFVKKGGIFEPKEILSGTQSGQYVEVIKGINSNDSLAYNAQFMIDSESFVKTKD